MVDICYNSFVVMNWREFITQKYLDWRQDKRGKKGSAAQFAREIGISPQLLSAWMNKGQTVTDQENINKLVNTFGFVVYDVLGLRRPDADDPRAVLLAAGLPSEFVDDVLAARDEYSEELARRGIDTDSPEAWEIINSALARHGLRMMDK